MKRQSFTQEEIMAALKKCARKLGRNPNLRELQAMAGITEKILWRRFGSLGKALEAAGLEASGPGFGLGEAKILLDWAASARKLGKIPSVHDYRMTGTFSHTPFLKRYGSWNGVGPAFRKFVEGQGSGLERRWRDVLKMISSEMAQGRERRAAMKSAERGEGKPPRLDPKLRKTGAICHPRLHKERAIREPWSW